MQEHTPGPKGQDRTDNVRVLHAPRSLSVGLPPAFKKTVLNVVYSDGTGDDLPISKKVAEILIAFGIPAEREFNK